MFNYRIISFGLKKFQDRLSVTRFRLAQRHALTVSADYVMEQLENASRVKSGTYREGWRKRKVSDDTREIVNVATNASGFNYVPFVTGRHQAPKATPTGAAGENFAASMRRRIGPEANRRKKEAFFEVLKR